MDVNVLHLLPSLSAIQVEWAMVWSYKKNPRSQTRRWDPAGVAPSGIAAACLFDQRPQKKQLAESFLITESGVDCIFSSTLSSA